MSFSNTEKKNNNYAFHLLLYTSLSRKKKLADKGLGYHDPNYVYKNLCQIGCTQLKTIFKTSQLIFFFDLVKKELRLYILPINFTQYSKYIKR